jgi:ribosomal protein S27AE
MTHDQEFLLYPFDTGEDPACPRCGAVMLLAAAEVHNDRANILTFRCGLCGRSERFLQEEE